MREGLYNRMVRDGESAVAEARTNAEANDIKLTLADEVDIALAAALQTLSNHASGVER